MRWERADLLAEIEIVGELGAVRLLALCYRRRDDALAPHPFAQAANQTRVLAEALDQNGAGAVQRGLGIGDALAGINVFAGLGRRIEHRVTEEGIRQRLQPRLAGDLRLGAPLRLVGRIKIFQRHLGLGRRNGRTKLRRHFALLVDAREHRLATLLQLPKVFESLLQLAQLRVIEAAGPLLAVAGDERHRRTLGQQIDNSRHLAGADAKLAGYALVDLVHRASGLVNRGARYHRGGGHRRAKPKTGA